MPPEFELHRQIQREITSSKDRGKALRRVPTLKTSRHVLQMQIPATSDHLILRPGLQQWFLLHHPVFSRQLRVPI